MIQRLVLLGTGTNVGKTFVGGALTSAFNQLGRVAIGLKPVESGVTSGVVTDADLLNRASPLRAASQRHCYALPEPISPHLAAARAGTLIDLSRIRSWVAEQESAYDTLHYVTIETAGGVFSPLAPGSTNLELAELFPDARWVLVAPDCLGVLHDVTACLHAMEKRARLPDYVVLSAARERDASTGFNADELEKLGITKVAAVLHRDDPRGILSFAAQLVRSVVPEGAADDGDSDEDTADDGGADSSPGSAGISAR